MATEKGYSDGAQERQDYQGAKDQDDRASAHSQEPVYGDQRQEADDAVAPNFGQVSG